MKRTVAHSRREDLLCADRAFRQGGRPATSLPLFSVLGKTPKNRLQAETEYRRMQDARRHPYLERERLLPADLLGSERFASRIRVDAHGNAVFPHFDEQGLCGYELKNRNFTGFAKGGEKGLWFSHTQADDDCLVFAESAIDALSYAVLHPAEHARYASIGGELNPKQPALIKAAVLRMPAGSEIISAMDCDDAGRGLSEVIGHAVQQSGRPDLSFRVHSPVKEGDDWNDVLKARTAPSFPTAHPRGSFLRKGPGV